MFKPEIDRSLVDTMSDSWPNLPLPTEEEGGPQSRSNIPPTTRFASEAGPVPSQGDELVASEVSQPTPVSKNPEHEQETTEGGSELYTVGGYKPKLYIHTVVKGHPTAPDVKEYEAKVEELRHIQLKLKKVEGKNKKLTEEVNDLKRENKKLVDESRGVEELKRENEKLVEESREIEELKRENKKLVEELKRKNKQLVGEIEGLEKKLMYLSIKGMISII